MDRMVITETKNVSRGIERSKGKTIGDEVVGGGWGWVTFAHQCQHFSAMLSNSPPANKS